MSPGYTAPMDSLALYRQGRYTEALSVAQHQDDPKALALALLALGRDGEAAEALEAWTPQGEAAAAERLALLGFLQARKGNLAAYRGLALAAARQASTPLVLYHLALALPPADGVVALEAALKGFTGPPEEEARLAHALAHILRRLGQFPQALAWASRAVLLNPHFPFYQLQELALEAYAGERAPSRDRPGPPPLPGPPGPGGADLRPLARPLAAGPGEQPGGGNRSRPAAGGGEPDP